MRLIRNFPRSFLFGDLCCAFAPCRKDFVKAGCNAHGNVHLFSRGAMNRYSE